jgi:hypothetical protein
LDGCAAGAGTSYLLFRQHYFFKHYYSVNLVSRY